MINQQPSFDIQAAIASEINLRSDPNKAIFPSVSDLNKLDSEIEKRRRDALATIKENKLKNTPKVELFEQARLKAKQAIFQKYYNIIEKELAVLKIQMQSLNEYDDEYYTLFRITPQPNSTNMRSKLILFELKLRQVRPSTCYFKYCYPTQSRCSCFFNWLLCWFTLPFYCCYKGCLKEDKSHARLQQLYERYEQLIVAENQAVACPHQRLK